MFFSLKVVVSSILDNLVNIHKVVHQWDGIHQEVILLVMIIVAMEVMVHMLVMALMGCFIILDMEVMVVDMEQVVYLNVFFVLVMLEGDVTL